jgi:hypothetical protein
MCPIRPIERHFLFTLGIVVGLGLVSPDLLSRSASATEPATPGLRYVGTGSCAAAACHGGRREPLGLKGSEYAFWSAYDPHRKAYGVLFDDRSKVIERNYRNLATLEESAPERDATCLSCHVHPNFEPTRVELEEHLVADGVGCESCHGPAERWLSVHAEGWWKGLPDREKFERFGMTPTKDLTARAEQCAVCHSGTPEAEVNHDLIAAGHPRLLYEFSNQQAKQPKHWRIEDDKARTPDYEVRAWALGQTVNSRSSLKLLESRATRAAASTNPAPWPEFAEYDCYSCHHDLKQPSRRQDGPRTEAGPGALPWGDWTLGSVRRIAAEKGLTSIDSKESALGRLQALMAKPGPDPAEVARLAKMASAEVSSLIDRVERESFGLSEVDSLLAGLMKSTTTPGASEWTPAARDYLGFVALGRARGDLGGAPLDGLTIERLSALRATLNVPNIRPGDGRLVDSPADYDPARVSTELRSIRQIFPR